MEPCGGKFLLRIKWKNHYLVIFLKKNHINTYIAKKLIEVKLKILDELKKI
jgi:hypothetical protein